MSRVFRTSPGVPITETHSRISTRMHQRMHQKIHQHMHPHLRALSKSIVTEWRRTAPGLRTLPLPPKFDSFSTQALDVTNIAFENATFRKMHLEIATGPKMSVVHCVLYPRPQFEIPILALDMVAFGETVTMAIADPCPVLPQLALSVPYHHAIRTIQKYHGVTPVLRDDMPQWGMPIFSDACIFMHPPTQEDAGAFVAYVRDLMNMHIVLANGAGPCQEVDRVIAAQARFCDYQLRNQKTRAALSAALGPADADEYLRTVMFDV